MGGRKIGTEIRRFYGEWWSGLTELLDKLERARFLAVVRLRREDEELADRLDRALFLVAESDGGITINTETAASEAREVELNRAFAESAGEEQLARLFVTLFRN